MTDTEDEIRERSTHQTDREIARDLDISEGQVKEVLEDLGFRRLTDFQDSAEEKTEHRLEYNLDDMEKRKLQGIFGEKVAVFAKGRLKQLISETLPADWELRDEVELRSEESGLSYSFGKKFPQDEIKVRGDMVIHYDASEEEIREQVRERCFHVDEHLFRKFQEHQIDNIDEVMYAVKTGGSNREVEFKSVDKNSSRLDGFDEMEFKVQEVEDFFVIGLEVKTTEDQPEKLFSKLQRQIRDKAQESPFIQMYSVKIDFDVQKSDIPKKTDIQIQKLS